jgi:predicted phage terminase large subunit-like protein
MFGIETVAYQKALKQELDRIGAQNGIYVPTTELVPDKDKVRRFMAVLPYIENGTVEFANTLPQEFFDELLAFPNGTNDDQVDALVNAVTLAIEGSFSLEITVL